MTVKITSRVEARRAQIMQYIIHGGVIVVNYIRRRYCYKLFTEALLLYTRRRYCYILGVSITPPNSVRILTCVGILT